MKDWRYTWRGPALVPARILGVLSMTADRSDFDPAVAGVHPAALGPGAADLERGLVVADLELDRGQTHRRCFCQADTFCGYVFFALPLVTLKKWRRDPVR